MKWNNNHTQHERMCNYENSRITTSKELLENLPDGLKLDYSAIDCSAMGANIPLILLRYTICSFHEELEKYGRPTYLVSKEVFDVVSNLDISEDDCRFCLEKIPYPAFCFVFERGCIPVNCSRPLQMISLIDSSSVKNRFPFKHDNNLPAYLIQGQPPTLEIGICGTFKNGKISPEAKLVASLLMLWRSRPEFVVNETLPRSERFEFKGDRKLIRKWILPDHLIVNTSSMIKDSTGSTRSPHWRAGHFRHYRSDRYKRNEDGSVKIEFIEPCFIGLSRIDK
jgi:hypothetical protein